MITIVSWGAVVLLGAAVLWLLWYLAEPLLDELFIRVSPKRAADVMMVAMTVIFYCALVLAYSGFVKLFVHEPYWGLVAHNTVVAGAGIALAWCLRKIFPRHRKRL